MSPNKILCLSGVQVGYTIRNVKTAEVRKYLFLARNETNSLDLYIRKAYFCSG